MEKKNILITGTSTGIGKECTKYLYEKGFQVFATVRNQQDANMIKSEISNDITTLILDVTDDALIEEAKKTVENKINGNGLHGLINNAAYILAGPVETHPIEVMKYEYDVNVLGTVRMVQTFLPLIRQAKGKIINIGSINGMISVPMLGSYCATKHGLEAITNALRLELIDWDIAVSSVAPDLIVTPAFEKGIGISKDHFNKLPKEKKALYEKKVNNMFTTATKAINQAKPALLIAKTVYKILEASNPKPRYIPGIDTKLGLFLQKILPQYFVDKLLLKEMGLKD